MQSSRQVAVSDYLFYECNMKIEFLGMTDGCPLTPELWNALQTALRQLKAEFTIDPLDVNELSEKHDIRAGYGSPTILVNGKDLFDAPVPTAFDPSCRYYRGGVPSADQVAEKLRSLSI